MHICLSTLDIAICLKASYGLRGSACVYTYMQCIPRQQKLNEMNGVHLASPIKGGLGYAHWPQLGTQFIALLGSKFGETDVCPNFALTVAKFVFSIICFQVESAFCLRLLN